MGQKVNPISLRLGVNRTWDSRWYADEKFTDYLHEDLKIRKFLKEKLAQAGISKVVIERPAKKARVTIHSARPGVVIGKKGQDIELLRKDIQKLTDSEVQLNILEVRKPELDAQLFFTLASCNPEQHLDNMSRLSEMLMNEDLVEELAQAKTSEDLLKLEEKYITE